MGEPLASVQKPTKDYGFNYLRNSRRPIPPSVAESFPDYSSLVARIGYSGVWGVPNQLFFRMDVCLSPNGGPLVASEPFLSLDGIVESPVPIGGGHGKIVQTAKLLLLKDEAQLVQTLSAYLLDSKQPVRGEAPLRL